jgi:hypothetical protein
MRAGLRGLGSAALGSAAFGSAAFGSAASLPLPLRRRKLGRQARAVPFLRILAVSDQRTSAATTGRRLSPGAI